MSKKKVFLGIAAVMVLSVGIVGFTAGAALANSGSIAANESCEGFSVTVTLNNNVSANRTVDVLTTIPGTTGFTGQHFDKSFGVIWTASGSQLVSGTVTLNIYKPSYGDLILEFSTSASVSPPDDCSSPTPTSPTPTPTSPTPTPTSPTPTPTPTKSPHKSPSPSVGPSVGGITGGTAFTGGNFTGAFVAILAFVLLGLGVLLVARQRAGEDPFGSPRDLY